MIYNREIKDYYCEHCKSSLAEVEGKADVDPINAEHEASEKKVDIKKETETKEPGSTEPQTITLPEVSTPRGLLFMMIGSAILMTILFLPQTCQIFGIIGIFLLILGFYLVYQDRKSHSNEHISNMKLAAFLIVVWIITYILTNIIILYITSISINEIANYKNADIIDNSIIISYNESIRILLITTPLIIGFLGIFRYLTIKSLIQPNLKKILTWILPFLILSGFLIMYVSMESINIDDSNLGETTKEKFINGDINNSAEIEMEIEYKILYYGSIFLNIFTETVMILCFYWTYKYQRVRSLL